MAGNENGTEKHNQKLAGLSCLACCYVVVTQGAFLV